MPRRGGIGRAVLAGLVWAGASGAAQADLAQPHLTINQDQDTITLIGSVSGPEGTAADTLLSVTRTDGSGNSMKSSQGKTVMLHGDAPVEVARLVINAGSHPRVVAILQVLKDDGVIAETRTVLGAAEPFDSNDSRTDE